MRFNDVLGRSLVEVRRGSRHVYVWKKRPHICSGLGSESSIGDNVALAIVTLRACKSQFRDFILLSEAYAHEGLIARSCLLAHCLATAHRELALHLESHVRESAEDLNAAYPCCRDVTTARFLKEIDVLA